MTKININFYRNKIKKAEEELIKSRLEKRYEQAGILSNHIKWMKEQIKCLEGRKC